MHSPKRKNQAVDGSKAISGVGTAKSISSISITCVELGSNSMEGFEARSSFGAVLNAALTIH